MQKKVKSRTEKTLISTATGFGGYLMTYIIIFIYRTFFISSLGKVYLGVEGLFSNILAMLALAELGVSTAITFSLYKPISEMNIEKIKSLMKYFKKLYFIIALVIATLGLALTPFLNFFVNTPPKISEPLWLIYLLYLASTVASYSVVYKQTLINADQKVYIVSLVQNLTTVFRSIFQIAWLLLVGTFIPVLVIQIVFQLLSNIVLARVANKHYPYLKDKNIIPLDIATKKNISIKVKSLFFYKIGAYVVNGTDNVLISKFIGIISVGLYSNYNTIITMAKTISLFFIKAVTPSVGNMTATKTPEENQKVFHELNFLVFWLYSLISLEFAVFFNSFIYLWIGSEYLIDFSIVVILIINFYMYGLHQNQLIYRNVLGLYVYCRWKPIAEAIINLFASLLFIKLYGFIGVFLGTTTSFVCTALWVEPYVLYKHYFKNGIKQYIFDYIEYAIFTLSIILICKYTLSFITNYSWMKLIGAAFLCLVVHAILIVVFFHKKSGFKNSVIRIKTLIFKKES